MLNLSEAPASDPYGKPTDLQTTAVTRVISAMHDHLYDPLSLRDMADIAHYSPYHFNRLLAKGHRDSAQPFPLRPAPQPDQAVARGDRSERHRDLLRGRL